MLLLEITFWLAIFLQACDFSSDQGRLRFESLVQAQAHLVRTRISHVAAWELLLGRGEESQAERAGVVTSLVAV